VASAVLMASVSSRNYSGQKPGGVASLGAEDTVAWRGGWPREEAVAAMQAAALRPAASGSSSLGSMASSEDSSGDSVSYDAGLGGLLCRARSSGEEIRRKQHTAARLGVKLSTASGQHRGIHEEGSIEGRPRTEGFLVLKPP
jgi:hypothetical protein